MRADKPGPGLAEMKLQLHGLRDRLAALTPGSKNQATKRGFVHKPHTTRQERRTELTAQVAATGQYGIVLPPQHRIRTDKVQQARPLNSEERRSRYLGTGLAARPELTPAQRKRLRKKLSHSVAASRRPR